MNTSFTIIIIIIIIIIIYLFIYSFIFFHRVLVIKDSAKMEEPASLDTQTKAIVVFALQNGRHMIVTKVPTILFELL